MVYSKDLDNNYADVMLQQALFTSYNQETTDIEFITIVKVKSFVSGSILAALSQIILYVFKLDDNNVGKPTSIVIMFSLQCSFLTLITVFVGISTQKYFLSRSDVADELIFQMEAYNIAGALSAIAVTWLLIDVITIPSQFIHDHSPLIIVATLIVYGSFCVSVLMQSRQVARLRRLRGDADFTDVTDAALSKTYHMIAGLSGLLTGASAQFLLVLFLWQVYDDAEAAKRILSAFLLSFFWFISTVGITTLGLWCTQQIVASEHICDVSQHKKLMLLVNSYYIRSTMIGICAAWLLLDIFIDATGTMLLPLGMPILSVLVFSATKVVCPDDYPDNSSEQEFLELLG